MESTATPTLASALAGELRSHRESLVAQWLERIASRMAVHHDEVFPTDELLDHVPLLVDGIAAYLENPAEEITADMPVVAKAMELGALRYAQSFEAAQILKEYEILGGILFHFLGQTAERLPLAASLAELMGCAQRLFRAVAVIQQVTTTHYLRLAREQVQEREARLTRFSRSLSHEFKNRIGAVRGAVEMLREDWIDADPEQRDRFTGIISRNVDGLQKVLQDLLELSRLDNAAQAARNVLLPDAAAEAARQLREFAGARGVGIRLADDLPRVEVPAAALELCLSNYISNAVKYRDPNEPESWVRVEGEVTTGAGDEGGCEVVVRVRDNGLGVPEEKRGQLFQRFFRAHDDTVTSEEGTGLGLSIVRETMQSLGGRAWAEWDGDEGAVFALALPCASEAAEG